MSEKKYIDADYLRQFVMPIKDHTGKVENIILYKNVETAPAADVEEIKHGKWLCDEMHIDGMLCTWNKWYCSECKVWVKKGWSNTVDGMKPTMLYCGECGAKMDMEE
jgi:hypothetical protein